MQVGELEICPNVEPVRWLGVFFNSKLNFRRHTEIWGAKGHKVGAHLQNLNRVTKGMLPAAAIRAVYACVILVATYRAEV